MRFLDPDEANLRLLCDGNPFTSWSPSVRAAERRSGGGSGGGGDNGATTTTRETTAVGSDRGDESVTVGDEEVEDFTSLTDSLGGFG